MNAHRARDHFSAYREGTLDKGLSAALDAAFANDPGLKAEFAQFCTVLDQLELERAQTVEAPVGLTDAILARVDKSSWESKRSAGKRLFSGWGLTIGFAAAAAAVAAGIFYFRPDPDGPQMAGMVTNRDADELAVRIKDGELRVACTQKPGRTVKFLQYADGVVFQSYDASTRRVDAPISNPSEKSVLVKVEAGSESLLVAVPGSKRTKPRPGSGSILDFALRVADGTGVPVEVRSRDLTKKSEWDYSTASAVYQSAKEAGWTLDLRSDGLFVLGD